MNRFEAHGLVAYIEYNSPEEAWYAVQRQAGDINRWEHDVAGVMIDKTHSEPVIEAWLRGPDGQLAGTQLARIATGARRSDRWSGIQRALEIIAVELQRRRK